MKLTFRGEDDPACNSPHSFVFCAGVPERCHVHGVSDEPICRYGGARGLVNLWSLALANLLSRCPETATHRRLLPAQMCGSTRTAATRALAISRLGYAPVSPDSSVLFCCRSFAPRHTCRCTAIYTHVYPHTISVLFNNCGCRVAPGAACQTRSTTVTSTKSEAVYKLESQDKA